MSIETLHDYIFKNCGCQYIKHERAYSAYITMCGYDYQEYELDEHSARLKLAGKLCVMQCAIEWFNLKKNQNKKQ